ncbi:MAG: PQQ-binding-like beta-propeller repeat protein [Planctomycetes bacterium]|nr:PQQ-binding-like beta-propeller repeat protein [Planctomycetota bacterium]
MQTGLSLRTSFSSRRLLSVFGILLVTSASVALASPADEAEQIAALTGFHGGLVIHAGCGDGQLTAALRLADNCVVQGLESDAERAEAARAAIRARGVYGPVSVVHWSGKTLPYVDNLATLVVCEDADAFPAEELMRVLRPYGTAVVKRQGHWTAITKPQLPGTDQWEQHFHGADNNAVAQDAVVGPPRRYQWLGEPQWQRSHLAMPSINSMVSTNGRLLTVEDLGSAEHPALPGKQALVARDAYNGVRLWQVMFSDWHPIYIRDKETPVQIQRRLAAVGDVVYCTPGYLAPITEYDAATGAVIKQHAGTAGTMEFVYDRGVLFVVTGDQSDIADSLTDPSRSPLNTSRFRSEAYGPTIDRPADPRNDIVAVDADSGDELWRISGADTKGYEGATLGATGDRVVFATSTELVCVHRATGKTLWRVPAPIVLKGPSGIAVSLVLSDRAAYLADSTQLRAFRLADGQRLWATPATINHHKPPDVFLADGLVWAAAYDASTGRPAPALGLPRMGVNGFDPETGELVKQLDQTMTGPMGHDRCYRNRITARYYINSVTGGSDFLGLDSSAEYPNPWIRSTCGIGPLPCNGLYYTGPPSCACCNSVMLNGMNALAAEPGLTESDQAIDVVATALLEKGPVFLENLNAKYQDSDATDDWPAYRHDNARTGTTKSRVPAVLVKRWETRLGTRASAPIIGAGMVFAADVDGHSVCAMNAADGKIVWRFSAEGRVDSPPTFYQGLLLFGSRDGSVYCLRAADGALGWRFHPLEPRLICAYGQPESAWPISGSILIRDGLAYFAAGRNSFTDGGIFLYAIDPRSGKVVHQKRMVGPYGESGFPVENREVVNGMSIEGFKTDIFIADDNLLYLRHQAFQPDLSPVRLQDVQTPHLIPSHGFLESIPQHRSFWTIDTMLHYDIPTGLGGIHGDILVIDGSRFYEVRGYTPGRTAWFDPRTNGYTLYAGTYGKPAAVSADAATTDTSKKVARRTAAKPNNAKRKQARNLRPSNVAPSSELWSSSIPLTGKAIVLADDVLFVAGTPVVFPEDDPAKAYEGRMGGILWAASASTGEKLAHYTLDAPPAWDSLAAANGRLFFALADGRVVCMGPPPGP